MNINIGDKCIIVKKDKEQVATIDGIFELNDRTYYSYYYGYVGFHEGTCRIEHIREFTNVEEEKRSKFWLLPQQFYQSIPE